MKILAFLLDGEESFRQFPPLRSLLQRLGHEVIAIPRWQHEFPPDVGAQLPVCDSPESIPRMTREEYLHLYGDDIDFAACSLYEIVAEGLPNDPKFLSLDSAYYQRLHTYAERVETLLRLLQPDLCIVEHGARATAVITAAKCLHASLPLLMFESPFVPGRLLLDPDGMHFYPGLSRLDRLWPAAAQHPLDFAERRRLDDFVSRWKQREASKYAQSSDPQERDLLARARASGRKVLFVPDQVPADASIVLGLGGFSSLDDFLDALQSSLPSDWTIVVKRHPKRPRPEVDRFLAGGRNLVVGRVNIHELIRMSDAVATFSSNVGFEALLYNKPVICGGKPHYRARGLTLDAENAEDLRGIFARAGSFTPEPDLLATFAHHVIFDYLIEEEDASALARRLDEAMRERPLAAHPRAPFARAFPSFCVEYQQRIAAYNALAERNFSPAEILVQLGGDAQPGGDLYDGERQVAPNLEAIDLLHVARYTFASEVLRGRRTVLDIACGCGYGSHLLAVRAGLQVTGVDSSVSTIEYARNYWQHPQVEFDAASAGSYLARETGPFDAAVCFETIEHLPHDELFLRQVWSRIAAGGILIGSVPNIASWPLGAHGFHLRHYSADRLANLVSALGEIAELHWLEQYLDGSIRFGSGGRVLIWVAQKRGGREEAGGTLRERMERHVPFALSSSSAGSTYFTPQRFFMTCPCAWRGSAAVVPLRQSGCLVYGPYVKLPAGNYEAWFDVQPAGDTGTHAAALISFEVFATLGDSMQLLEKSDRSVAALQAARGVRIAFSNRDQDTRLEFRILAPAPLPGCELQFNFVSVNAGLAS